MASSMVAGGKRADLSVAGAQGLVPGPHLSGQGNQVDPSARPGPGRGSAAPLWGLGLLLPTREIPQGAWAGGPQGTEPSLLDTPGPVLLHVPAGVHCTPIAPQTIGPPQGPPGCASRGAPPPEAVWGRVLRKMSWGSAGASGEAGSFQAEGRASLKALRQVRARQGRKEQRPRRESKAGGRSLGTQGPG